MLREDPDPNLVRCAERPTGFSPTAWAQMPPDVAAKVTEVALAFGAIADRLDRLVNWHEPGKCPAPR